MWRPMLSKVGKSKHGLNRTLVDLDWKSVPSRIRITFVGDTPLSSWVSNSTVSIPDCLPKYTRKLRCDLGTSRFNGRSMSTLLGVSFVCFRGLAGYSN